MKQFRLVSFDEFGKAFVPEKWRPNLRKYLMKAGVYDVPYTLFGLLFIVAILITAAIYIIYLNPLFEGKGALLMFLFTFISWAGILIGIAFLFMMVIYTYLDVRIIERTRKIEEVLDEFLMLVSENLKGGYSLDKALWASVKPEFGVLAREIEVASKKVATGEDVEDALGEFIEKYESPMTRRAFELMIEETRTGGQIAMTIDKVIDDIKETKLLKSDIIATNTQYVIFISAIVSFISPLLFALSYQLLTILIKFSSKLAPALKTASSSVPFTMSELSISLPDFRLFSSVAIGLVAIFSSMLIAEINRGNLKTGIKYIPPAIILSLFMYEAFMKVFSLIFSGLVF
jgi:pilus assembly protein TadC